MTAEKLTALLQDLRACEEAVAWSAGKSLTEAWNQCDRGDWLLWLCGHMADKKGWPSRKHLVLAACACAETALEYVQKGGEERHRIAIDTARKWANGAATLRDVRTAAHAAATATYDAAVTAAHTAAVTAAYAATGTAHTAYATYAHAAAAHAAAAHAAAAHGAAAHGAARKKALLQCAEIVRSMLTVPAYYSGGQ